jgi:hypothetical protein
VLEPPVLNAATATLSDWMELHTLSSPRRETNDTELIALGQLADDREDVDTIEADARLERLADEVFDELDRRLVATHGSYPFALSETGTRLTLKEGHLTDGNYAYLFCLLVSEYRRQEMLARSIFAPVIAEVEDLFQVCSTIAAAGFLNGFAVSFGFPRPDGSGFLAALRRTYQERMREGETEAAARPGVSSHTKDGGIDIIAWRDFPDGLPSKLYLLGQCASGAAYPSKGVRSFISSFHGDWFTKAPASPPIEALFVPFMLDHDLVVRPSERPTQARSGRYLSLGRDLGVIIDRCRIAHLVDGGIALAHENPDAVERAAEIHRVREWVNSVWQLMVRST